MASRPRFELSPGRLIAAVPFVVVAVSFGLAGIAIGSPDERVSDAMRSMASWPAYEFLASAYAMLLPLAGTIAAVVRRSSPARASWATRGGAMALMAFPFLVVAWAIAVPVFGSWWFFLAFVAFTVVHLVSFECAEVRLADRVSKLRRSAFCFAKCYGFAVLAAMLAVIVWIIPTEAVGETIENGDHRMVFLSIAVGSIYFLLHAASELFDFDGLLAGARERQAAREQRRKSWAKRNPDAAPADRARRGRTSPERLAELELEDSTVDKIQHWDAELVRFGRSLRKRKKERRIYAGIAAVTFVIAVLALWIGTDSRMFEKKYTRARSPYRYPMRTHSGEIPTAETDRAAFRAISGFFWLFAIGFGIAWWRLRKDQLDRPLAFVDRTHGDVRGRSGEPARISKCELVVTDGLPGGATPQSASVYRSPATGESWNLVARTTRKLPGGSTRVEDIALLRGVSLRDAELVGNELLSFGFTGLSRDRDRPGPELTIQLSSWSTSGRP